MAKLIPPLKFRGVDGNNAPLVGGKLYTYLAGTTTPLATFTDSSEESENTNPIVLDANGEADVYIGTGNYKFFLTDADDNPIYTQDNVSLPTSGTPGSSFTIDDGIPNDANGQNGDSYLDNETGIFYVKSAGVWVENGGISTFISAGSKIYTDPGAPDDGDGIDGDIYINETNYDIYQKAGGTWGSPWGNIKGAPGTNGTNGTNGTDGLITAIADTDSIALTEVAGELAAEVKEDGIETAMLQDGSVTNEKAADMAAWTLKGRNNAASGAPQDIAVGDLTEETEPAEEDFAIIYKSTGALRKVALENMLGGGGGGAILNWYYGDSLAPTERILENGGRVLDFSNTDSQVMYAVLTLPETYEPGTQVKLIGGKVQSAINSGNFLYRVTAKILKSGVEGGSVLNVHTSTNSQQAINGTANRITEMDEIDVSDSDGEIDNVALAPSNSILIAFYRDIINETSAVAGVVSYWRDSLVPKTTA